MTSRMRYSLHWTLLSLPTWISTILIRQMRKFKAISLIAVLILCALSLVPGTAIAATSEILIGSKQGELVFEPSTVTIKSGDTIKWVNNLAADSPCNVVFEQAEFKGIPTAADEDKAGYDQNLFDYISHKSLVNAPNKSFKKEFNVPPGEYTYACTPHQDAGMVGKVIVKSS